MSNQQQICRNRFDLPYLGYGLGLRTRYYEESYNASEHVDWYEVISDNYLPRKNNQWHAGHCQQLEKISQRFPIVAHGVALSIGSPEELDHDYLNALEQFSNRFKPLWLSEHFCWTGINQQNSHDLLPLIYNEASIKLCVDKIKRLQDRFSRVFLFENPSSYLAFSASTIPEEEFIARVCDAADCGILLDINNVYVSCKNQNLSLERYLQAIDFSRVGQIHLAGYEDRGRYLYDSHSASVAEPVWQIYKNIIAKHGKISTLLEWDNNLPAFDTLIEQLNTAKSITQTAVQTTSNVSSSTTYQQNFLETSASTQDTKNISHIYHHFQAQILKQQVDDDNGLFKMENILASATSDKLSTHEKIDIYRDAYYSRINTMLAHEYANLCDYSGKEFFADYVDQYLHANLHSSYDIETHIHQFYEFIAHKNALNNIETKEHCLILAITKIDYANIQITRNNFGTAMQLDEFSNIDPEAFFSIQFQLIPCCHLLELSISDLDKIQLTTLKCYLPISERVDNQIENYNLPAQSSDATQDLIAHLHYLYYTGTEELASVALDEVEFDILNKMPNNNAFALIKFLQDKYQITSQKSIERLQQTLSKFLFLKVIQTLGNS